MDKSGRRALAANLAAITKAAGSRLSWTATRGVDTKTVERAEKNEGEKGVSLQALDDIAKGLNVWPWQLLVPGLDLRNPPRLVTEAPSEPSIERALEIIRDSLARAHGNESALLGDALKLLAMTPDSERAFRNVLSALIPTPRQDSPLESGASRPMGHAMSLPPTETRLADPQVIGVGSQPEGGEEWKRRGKRIGPNIKPINRTTGLAQKADKERKK